MRNLHRIRLFAWLSLGLVSLVGAGVVTSRLVSRWESSRPQKIMEESMRLFQKGEADQAMLLLLKLQQRVPNNPAVLRELARRCDEFPGHADDALLFWQRLSKIPGTTEDDRIGLASALVKVGDGPAARTVLDSLSKSTRLLVRCAELEAALLHQAGRDTEASKIMAEAWMRSANEPSSRLKLAQMDFASPFDAVHAEAKRTLWEFARGEGALSINALLTLASARLSPTEADEIGGIISHRDDINTANRLKILGFCIQQFPAKKEKIVATEAGRLQALPLEKRGDFYEWLASLGLTGAILRDLSEKEPPTATSPHPDASPDIRPRGAVMKSRGLFLAYSDALLKSKKWDAFERLIHQPVVPISYVELELLQAVSARQRLQPATEIDTHLSNAMNHARNAHAMIDFSRVADVAETLSRPAIAIEALGLLSKDRLNRFKCLVHSFRLQRTLHDSEAMLQTAEAILEIRPGLQPFSDEALYLGILTGRKIESASQIIDATPDDPGPDLTPFRRLVSALAAYHRGDMERVRSWMAGLNPSDLQAGPRAVLAGLMSEAGHQVEAFRIAEKILPATLAPDEFWFYRLALR